MNCDRIFLKILFNHLKMWRWLPVHGLPVCARLPTLGDGCVLLHFNVTFAVCVFTHFPVWGGLLRAARLSSMPRAALLPAGSCPLIPEAPTVPWDRLCHHHPGGDRVHFLVSPSPRGRHRQRSPWAGARSEWEVAGLHTRWPQWPSGTCWGCGAGFITAPALALVSAAFRLCCKRVLVPDNATRPIHLKFLWDNESFKLKVGVF